MSVLDKVRGLFAGRKDKLHKGIDKARDVADKAVDKIAGEDDGDTPDDDTTKDDDTTS